MPSPVDTNATSHAAAPTVSAFSFLTLHYRLSGVDGRVYIDTFAGKPATLSMGAGELAPALEQCLIGLSEGAQCQFDLPAGAAFGDHKPELRQWVARKLLADLGDPDEQYAPGDVVRFPTPDGTGQYAGTVCETRGDDAAVLFDFNHPLAGQRVRFDVRLIGVL